VALDPASSEARTERALTKWEGWDWSGAEEEYRRVITLSPNNAFAHKRLGDCLDAMELWKKAGRSTNSPRSSTPIRTTSPAHSFRGVTMMVRLRCSKRRSRVVLRMPCCAILC